MYYIKKIKLSNIRGFKNLVIDLGLNGNKPRLNTLIVGKNGTGKTTLLRCITIGLLDVADSHALVAENTGQLVSEKEPAAEIRIELESIETNPKKIELITEIKKSNGKETVKSKKGNIGNLDSILVCGYGIGRTNMGIVEHFRSYRIIDSAYSLFQYEQPFQDSELVLRRLKDYLGSKFYGKMMIGIKKALCLPKDVEIDFEKGGGIIISGATIGDAIPLQGWADGYKLTFGWILDFYGWAMRAKKISDSGAIQGILLIDELEQHIHPSMQTEILLRLKELFPDVQIFATTHSPLVSLSAKPDELVVLRREQKYVKKEERVPDFTKYSAEDMLVDKRLFDSDVYSPETNQKLNEYRNLLQIPKKKRQKTQTEQIKKLAGELRTEQIPEVFETQLAKELKKFRQKYDL